MSGAPAPSPPSPAVIARIESAVPDRLRYRNSLRLFDLWRRDGFGAHFDPIDAPDLLPHLYLLEREPGPEGAPDRLRYRVSGGAVNALFGAEHTGRTLDQVVPARLYPLVAPYFLSVARGETVCVFQGRVVLPDREFHFFERLLLPIMRRGQPMLLGCLSLSDLDEKRPGGSPEAAGYHFYTLNLSDGAEAEAALPIKTLDRKDMAETGR